MAQGGKSRQKGQAGKQALGAAAPHHTRPRRPAPMATVLALPERPDHGLLAGKTSPLPPPEPGGPSLCKAGPHITRTQAFPSQARPLRLPRQVQIFHPLAALAWDGGTNPPISPPLVLRGVGENAPQGVTTASSISLESLIPASPPAPLGHRPSLPLAKSTNHSVSEDQVGTTTTQQTKETAHLKNIHKLEPHPKNPRKG